jgi:hypothetical protein
LYCYNYGNLFNGSEEDLLCLSAYYFSLFLGVVFFEKCDRVFDVGGMGEAEGAEREVKEADG